MKKKEHDNSSEMVCYLLCVVGLSVIGYGVVYGGFDFSFMIFSQYDEIYREDCNQFCLSEGYTESEPFYYYNDISIMNCICSIERCGNDYYTYDCFNIDRKYYYNIENTGVICIHVNQVWWG